MIAANDNQPLIPIDALFNGFNWANAIAIVSAIKPEGYAQ